MNGYAYTRYPGEEVRVEEKHNDDVTQDYRIELELPDKVSKAKTGEIITTLLSDFSRYSSHEVVSVDYYKPLSKGAYVIIYGNSMPQMLNFAEDLFDCGVQLIREYGEWSNRQLFVLAKDQRNDTMVEEGRLEDGRWHWHTYDGVYD